MASLRVLNQPGGEDSTNLVERGLTQPGGERIKPTWWREY